jgi:lipopolysaccharide transport system permease protein
MGLVRHAMWPGSPNEGEAAVASSHYVGMFADLKSATIEVWEHRELLEQLTRRDIKLRYKQAAMGFAWAVFMPCLIVLSGLIIRFAMAQISGQTLVRSDIANIAVKGVGWAFFVGALGFATASLVGNSNLVTKIYFPREVLPLSSVGAQAFDTAIGLMTLVIILPFLGVRLHASLAWVPLLLVLLVLFTTGVSLFLSCANLFFRDVKYIVQVVLMFGIFFTPIFFEPAMLGPRGAYLAMLNPLTGILEGLRLSVVEGRNLLYPISVVVKGVERSVWEPWELVYSAVCAVIGMMGAALMFRRLQHLFAEYV